VIISVGYRVIINWIAKLDEFLKTSEKELLTHAGSISAEAAAQKAEGEFEKYRIERNKKMISDFDLAITPDRSLRVTGQSL